MAQVKPELWADREWNTEIGRIVGWIIQAKRTNTHLSKQAARLFWRELCAEHGSAEAERRLKAAGVDRLPDWLEK